MKSALATLVLLVFAGTVYTQTGAAPRSRTVPQADAPLLPPREDTATVQKEPTIDELIAQIMKVREQKAALEKKEKDLTALLRGKVGKQTELLNKLGLGDQVPYSIPVEPGFPTIPAPGSTPPGGVPAPAAAPPGSVPVPGYAPAVGSPRPGGAPAIPLRPAGGR